MTATGASRGAAPVGSVADLPEVELAAVLYLRLWCASAETRAAVWNDFACAFGADEGRRRLGEFEHLVDLLNRFARRPLVHHAVRCRCLGADESAVANLVAAAGSGQREEAMMISALIARADMAPMIVALAEAVGHGFRRMALRSGTGAEPRHAATGTRH